MNGFWMSVGGYLSVQIYDYQPFKLIGSLCASSAASEHDLFPDSGSTLSISWTIKNTPLSYSRMLVPSYSFITDAEILISQIYAAWSSSVPQ